MRLLLPPSESKRDGTSQNPVFLPGLAAPQLERDRERVVAALARFCARPSPRVRAAIGTTVNQDGELLRNAGIRDAPTAAAFAVYDGVLFDAIDLPSCSAATRQRLVERVLVQSALFGVVGFGDHIPAYRCSADSALPRIGRVGSFWRQRLDGAMAGLLADQLVIDMRSGPYAAMWTPSHDRSARVVGVKVMQMRDGRRLAVSHMNKATKGLLVRALCEPAREPASVDEVAHVLAVAGYAVETTTVQGRHIIEVMAAAPSAT